MQSLIDLQSCPGDTHIQQQKRCKCPPIKTHTNCKQLIRPKWLSSIRSAITLCLYYPVSYAYNAHIISKKAFLYKPELPMKCIHTHTYTILPSPYPNPLVTRFQPFQSFFSFSNTLSYLGIPSHLLLFHFNQRSLCKCMYIFQIKYSRWS